MPCRETNTGFKSNACGVQVALGTQVAPWQPWGAALGPGTAPGDLRWQPWDAALLMMQQMQWRQTAAGGRPQGLDLQQRHGSCKTGGDWQLMDAAEGMGLVRRSSGMGLVKQAAAVS